MLQKILFCTGFVLFLGMGLYAQAKGHHTHPPAWAPANGFRAKTRHVFFPEHNFYYDLEKKVYIHLQAGRWVSTPDLPSRLANQNLRNASKFELDLDIDNPQVYNAEHLFRFRPKYAMADIDLPN